VATITNSYAKKHNHMSKTHQASNILVSVVGHAFLSQQRWALSKMTTPKRDAMKNLCKWVARQGEFALRAYFNYWAQDMLKERALDWEQHYITQIVIRSFFTNFAKFN
jgi:hypothetical protein